MNVIRVLVREQDGVDVIENVGNSSIALGAKYLIEDKNKVALITTAGSSDLTGKVLEVLIRNHRINQMDVVVEALTELVNAELNIAIADVRAAHKLSEQELAQLRKKLEQKAGRRVEVRLTTDPSLIGGFVAKIGSEVFDASVVGKIHKFREHLES